MSESTPISIARMPDKNWTFSTIPFDPYIQGDILAYPRISREQLEILQEGIPDKVQRLLQSLTNL